MEFNNTISFVDNHFESDNNGIGNNTSDKESVESSMLSSNYK